MLPPSSVEKARAARVKLLAVAAWCAVGWWAMNSLNSANARAEGFRLPAPGGISRLPAATAPTVLPPRRWVAIDYSDSPSENAVPLWQACDLFDENHRQEPRPDRLTGREWLWEGWWFADQQAMYARRNCFCLAAALTLGGTVANTQADQSVRDWYQNDLNMQWANGAANVGKQFGEGALMFPLAITLALADDYMQDIPVASTCGAWGTQCVRMYTVGAVPVLALQLMTGASRPGERAHASHWRPFADNNGVSGHAFVGAVPFLAAASLCENRWQKGAWYLASTWTAWTRVHDDAHFLSQAILGWYIAYLCCEATERTDERRWHVAPLAMQDGAGVGLFGSY